MRKPATGSRRLREEGDFRDSTYAADLHVHGRLLWRASPTEPFEVAGFNSFDSEQALRDYLAEIPVREHLLNAAAISRHFHRTRAD